MSSRKNLMDDFERDLLDEEAEENEDEVQEESVGGARTRREADDVDEDDGVVEERVIDYIGVDDNEEEEEGEDLFGDDVFEKDYKYLMDAKNDQYEIDERAEEEEAEPMTYSERMAAEEALRKRDLIEAKERESERGENQYRRMFHTIRAAFEDEEIGDEDGTLGRTSRNRGRPQLGDWMQQDDDDEEAEANHQRVLAMMNSELRPDEMVDGGSSSSDDDSDEEDDGIELEEFKGSIKEWIAMESSRKKISSEFRRFLEQTQDRSNTQANQQPRQRTGQSTGFFYKDRILEMSVNNRETLVIEYSHLCRHSPLLSIWLIDEPTEMLKIFDEVAFKFAKSLMPLLFGSRRIGGLTTSGGNASRAPQEQRMEVHVRINGIPVCESLRNLRQNQLNQLVKISGVVTRRTAVYPQLKIVHFECGSCQGLIGPIVINTDTNSRSANIPKPQMCPHCQATGNGGGGSGASTHFNINQSRTVYRNYQRLTLQESPGTVPPGRIPRSKDVILTNDLIDCARPGEEVVVTGIYKHSYDVSLNARQGFPVFATILEANHVTGGSRSSIGGNSSYLYQQLTEQDKHAIQEFSKKPKLLNKIVKSIAPSIFGHEDIKLGLALSLFGGVPKSIEGKQHQTRGDINVLLVGDPGTAKSQFLKYIEKIAHRAVYTTGKGSTAVGLTAAVRKDPMTKEWTLEGGALVLADHGVCLIDEFDKMNDQDRTSIHEAMEQQTISISKAGIVTTLQARCSVIAAANPVKGRYDTSKTFRENVDLTDPILSRFDVLCVVKDTVNPAVDERLAEFVVSSHMNSHPTARKRKRLQDQEAENKRATQGDQDNSRTADPLLDMEMRDDTGEDALQASSSLFKRIRPSEDPEIMAQDFLKKYIVYAKEKIHPKLHLIDGDKLTEFYKELRKESANSGGIPITVRHFESTIRMAEACARLHLRDYVTEFDINTAIQVMLESFVQTQKHSISRSLRNKFKRYLLSEQQEYNFLMHLLVNTCLKDAQIHSNMHRASHQRKRRRIAEDADDIAAGEDGEDDEDEEGIKIEFEDFNNAARQYSIYSGLKSFLRSEFCKSRGFTYIESESYILYVEPSMDQYEDMPILPGRPSTAPLPPYQMNFSQVTQSQV